MYAAKSILNLSGNIIFRLNNSTANGGGVRAWNSHLIFIGTSIFRDNSGPPTIPMEELMHLKAHSLLAEVTDTTTVLEAMNPSLHSSYLIQHSSKVVEYIQVEAHYTSTGTISLVVTQYSMMVGDILLEQHSVVQCHQFQFKLRYAQRWRDIRTKFISHFQWKQQFHSKHGCKGWGRVSDKFIQLSS